MGDVLVNFTPLKVKTNCNCRFEKIKAEVKIIHYKLSCLLKGHCYAIWNFRKS